MEGKQRALVVTVSKCLKRVRNPCLAGPKSPSSHCIPLPRMVAGLCSRALGLPPASQLAQAQLPECTLASLTVWIPGNTMHARKPGTPIALSLFKLQHKPVPWPLIPHGGYFLICPLPSQTLASATSTRHSQARNAELRKASRLTRAAAPSPAHGNAPAGHSHWPV